VSAVPKSSVEEPAGSNAPRGNADDGIETLHRLWELATIEIMHAQRDYIELEGPSSVDDRLLAEAWLRLWRAEQRQRELAALIG
jgi:hypothetical protein